MYEKLDKCPLCNSVSISNFLICKDHLVSGESFAVNYCKNCTLQFTNPRPDNTILNNYYQSKNYISHTNKGNNLVNFIYKLARKFTLKRKLKLVNHYAIHGRILDVGCGTGDFLHTCKNNRWIITGVEPDLKARQMAEDVTRNSIYDALDKVTSKDKFDAITLWHVLEHLPDLHSTMISLKSLLKSKGKLFIALPNVESYDARKYKESWAAYDVPRHFYHFNRKSFDFLVKEHDLQIEDILPMKLDAFYIAILSEKYKNNKSNLIKSIMTGLKSNRYARKHNDNYSSLIYILKK